MMIPRGRMFSANKIQVRMLCGGLAVLRYWKSEGRHCPERFIRILSAEDHFGSRIASTRWLPLFECSKWWLRTGKSTLWIACPPLAGNWSRGKVPGSLIVRVVRGDLKGAKYGFYENPRPPHRMSSTSVKRGASAEIAKVFSEVVVGREHFNRRGTLGLSIRTLQFCFRYWNSRLFLRKAVSGWQSSLPQEGLRIRLAAVVTG